eukprot:scaffold24704_cov113-Skeletonema_dohrnii-CCMP3373.AAC.1
MIIKTTHYVAEVIRFVSLAHSNYADKYTTFCNHAQFISNNYDLMATKKVNHKHVGSVRSRSMRNRGTFVTQLRISPAHRNQKHSFSVLPMPMLLYTNAR